MLQQSDKTYFSTLFISIHFHNTSCNWWSSLSPKFHPEHFWWSCLKCQWHYSPYNHFSNSVLDRLPDLAWMQTMSMTLFIFEEGDESSWRSHWSPDDPDLNRDGMSMTFCTVPPALFQKKFWWLTDRFWRRAWIMSVTLPSLVSAAQDQNPDLKFIFRTKKCQWHCFSVRASDAMTGVLS